MYVISFRFDDCGIATSAVTRNCGGLLHTVCSRLYPPAPLPFNLPYRSGSLSGVVRPIQTSCRFQLLRQVFFGI